MYGGSAEAILNPPPGLLRLAFDIAVFTAIDEVLFFYGHWALHTKWLYAPIHKKHHEWKAGGILICAYSSLKN